MKIIVLIVLLLILLGGGIFILRKRPQAEVPRETLISSMRIESPAFGHNQPIPPKYTCDGDDVSPPLKISDVPANAKSLALIMDDPDAPRPGGWLHWTVWNIAPSTNEIPENVRVVDVAAPQSGASLAQQIVGREGTTDFGRPGYGGPCPPSGTHRYFFKLYALDTMLNLPAGAKLSELESTTAGHILAQAELIGLYSRQR